MPKHTLKEETFAGRNFRWKKLSLEETFAGRNFRGFAVFWPIRESLFREIFRTEASAKVYSREIQESRIIYDVASKNG